MESDDELGRAFEQVATRLQIEIAERVTDALAELSASIQSDRARAVSEAARDARAAAERDVSERLAASLAAAEGRARADFEGAETAANARLVAAIRGLDRGRSLTEIVDVLVTSAVAEARRAALFLPEDGRLRALGSKGFDAAAPETELIVAFDEAGVIADAAATGTVTRAGADASSFSRAPTFAGLPDDRPAVAVPLTMAGQVIAVLYVDQGSTGDIDRAWWPQTIEVLALHAARLLETMTAARLAQLVEGDDGKLQEQF